MASLEGMKADAELAMQAGDKAFNRTGMASWFQAKSQKYEDASEFYVKAGNKFKGANMWNEAGIAYGRAAECFQLTDDVSSAAQHHSKAAECFQKTNPPAAIDAWRKAIESYAELGRFNQCGNLYKSLGELYESDALGAAAEDSSRDAIDCFELAAENYEKESPPRTQAANGCKEKVATLCGADKQFKKASGIFKELAFSCLQSNLLKFNAKGHILKAIVCILPTEDLVQARDLVDEFSSRDHTFTSPLREYMFVNQLIDAMQAGDAQAFGNACAEFNQVKKLDPWMTSILLSARRALPTEDEAAESEEEPDVQDEDEEDEDDLT